MVRRPQNEYILEDETEKKTIQLPNGAKLRVLFLPSDKQTKETKKIVFYSGFISYIYLWKESIKLLRKKHSIIFIETREKEFSSFPPNEIRYDYDSLGEDFLQAMEVLELDPMECVIAGSSVASVGVLEAMSEHNYQAFLSVHSSPQAHYKANNKPKTLGTYFPYWFIAMVKPIVFLIYKIKFRRDKESGRSRIHTLRRMLQKSQVQWMKKLESFMPEYNMKKEAVKNISCPIVIVGAVDDPEHDASSVKKLVDLVPRAKFRPVPFKDDTHNETFAKIILEEIQLRV